MINTVIAIDSIKYNCPSFLIEPPHIMLDGIIPATIKTWMMIIRDDRQINTKPAIFRIATPIGSSDLFFLHMQGGIF